MKCIRQQYVFKLPAMGSFDMLLFLFLAVMKHGELLSDCSAVHRHTVLELIYKLVDTDKH